MHSYLHGHPALLDAVKHLEHLNPDQFELYFERKSSTRIESKDQQVESLTRAEDVGLSIRVIKDQPARLQLHDFARQKPRSKKPSKPRLKSLQSCPKIRISGLFTTSATPFIRTIDLLDSKGLAVR